jgi:hypothetical protein
MENALALSRTRSRHNLQIFFHHRARILAKTPRLNCEYSVTTPSGAF